MCAFYVHTCVLLEHFVIIVCVCVAAVRLYWKMRMSRILIGRESSKKVNVTAMGPIDWRRAQIAGVWPMCVRCKYVISDVRWNRFSQQWAKSTSLNVRIGHNSASAICDCLQCELAELSTSACTFRTLFDARRRVGCSIEQRKDYTTINHTRIYDEKRYRIIQSAICLARLSCFQPLDPPPNEPTMCT